MNDKAKAALAPFLSRFGQFLEMDCAGEPRWFYNVTNLISCIDEARSTKRPSGSLVREEFFDDKVPLDAAVFKDPLTVAAVLYVNEAGKAVLEAIITDAAIVAWPSPNSAHHPRSLVRAVDPADHFQPRSSELADVAVRCFSGPHGLTIFHRSSLDKAFHPSASISEPARERLPRFGERIAAESACRKAVMRLNRRRHLPSRSHSRLDVASSSGNAACMAARIAR
jgi:hypothetical protein